MKFRVFRSLIALWVCVPLLVTGQLLAQSSSGALRGQVVDPSGAAVPGATVSVSSVSGQKASAKTSRNGAYEIKGLPPGTYTIHVEAPSFSPFQQGNVVVVAGRVRQLKISLKIQQQVEQVTVSAEATHLSVNPEENASAVVITGKALQSLSDDPDELQAELEALAGPAAGPNGGQIYIDGFTGGQLPPKSDILEIHINQNPFSAEYDKVGYGRIEIITKPGSSHYHGSFFADGNDSSFNSRNPFITEVPGYHSDFMNGNLGGPLGKNASFFVDAFHRGINASSVVDGIVLNPDLVQAPLTEGVPNPQSRTLFTPRVDYQISSKNVLVARYFLWQDHSTNAGIGQLVLPQEAYNTSSREQALELSDTQILSGKTVNQTRFEYRNDIADQTPQSLDPAVNVLGAFNGGGSTEGTNDDDTNYFELQNITTMTLGKHTVIYGGRVRDWDDSNSDNANFNGTFTFPTIAAYQLTEQGLEQDLPFDQIQALGGGPSQFAITAGNPVARINLFDMGLYAEDQWRARQNLSLSTGIRFESQNIISDHADFAPRMGLAWGFGRARSPKTVLRAGFGLFYDRFEEQNALQAERLNGVNQQQYLITDPDFFPTVPSLSTLSTLANAATSPTVYATDQSLRAPYTIQSAIGLEQQIGKNATASVTYLNSHGVHQFLTRNINTPLPGEYDPADPSYGRPFANVSACGVVVVPDCAAGFDGNIYQFESDGLYNQNEVIANFRVNEGAFLSLFGYYTLNFADSDTSGISSFPSNPYDILEDYGQATFAIRNRFVVGGAISLPFGFRLMPFAIANSGTPYNVTLGQDLIGSSVFNQRPALVPPGTTGPNILATSVGTFNIDPALGTPLIPVNYLTGPSAFTFNFHLEKTFGFGKKEDHGNGGGGGFYHHSQGLGGRGLSGGGGHPSWWGNPENTKYNLTFGISVHNVFNNINLGTPVGNLGSPLFGRSNSLAGGPFSTQAANRRIDLQVRFTF